MLPNLALTRHSWCWISIVPRGRRSGGRCGWHISCAHRGCPLSGAAGRYFISGWEVSRVINFQDKQLRCRDCGVEFAFTAGEQEFYLRKGLMNQPTRCPTCRASRKERQTNGDDATTRMAGTGLGRNGSAGTPRRQFYYTICTECGGEARVPFPPRSDRPVYCSECFERVRIG